MTSHTGRTYLNTCLKVPIDPSNNCPAPVYNRSKMYLGRLSQTPTTATAVINKHCDTGDTEAKWSCSGIRSLAKFYDSIPDYGDLNHLTEEEFYSTLDTLRSTCREFKVKSVNTCPILEDRCSTTTTSSSLISSHCLLSGGGGGGTGRTKKSKKSKKKKKSNVQHGNRKCFESQESDYLQEFLNARTSINSVEPCYRSEKKKPHDSLPTKSLKKELDEEVENFKKSLKDFETEFKRPHSSSRNRNESRSFTRSTAKEYKDKSEELNNNSTEKVPVRTTTTSTLRERLRKSLSFNDLHSIPEPIELIELRKKNKTLEKLSFNGDKHAFQDPGRLSNYFKEKPKYEVTGNVPKIIVDTPTTDLSTDRSENKSKKKTSKNEDYQIPFKVFDLDAMKKENLIKHSSPSPVHPVARPNLAATLREESAKKKVKELKNNCTYHDTTPQVDWEVRKTPAWKTLSLNETHKNILSLRLATRKAEQDLQQREYELNMELMRQRVKSAPLLLEGPTYWGPHVGKLTHTCQREARRHMCQSNLQRMKRKKNSSRSHSCRRSLFCNSSTPFDCENAFEASANTFRVQQESRMSQKLMVLRKIYGGNNSTKSQSRCSNHSTNTQQSLKGHCKKKSNEVKPSKREKPLTVDNDSGDELSSLDRAFL